VDNAAVKTVQHRVCRKGGKKRRPAEHANGEYRDRPERLDVRAERRDETRERSRVEDTLMPQPGGTDRKLTAIG